MANWRLAESLKKLREQINTAFPDRSKASDGSIGDAAHSARTSDHNPNDAGVVCAIDVTSDVKSGCTGDYLAAELVKSRDPRIKYIIWNRRIIKAYKDKGGIPAWTWQKYTGPNAHAHHIHISVGPEKIKYDDRADWDLDSDVAVVVDELEAAGDEAIQHSGAADLSPQPPVEPPPAEKIAIEKPERKSFGAEIKKDLGVVGLGEVGLQGVREAAEGAKFLGLSARFWVWVSIIALVAGAGYLIAKFYKHWSETKRDLELTNHLITANTTDSNKVVLADADKIDQFVAAGYKIIHR
jgi:hypothetical protein